MRLLILGARGMLGRALAEEFRNEETTAWDKEELDITNEQAVGEYLPALEPDIVLNAAAYTDVDRAEDETEDADAVNGHAVGNLAVTCAEMDVPLLHLSTDYVFDGRKSAGYTEADEPTQPVNAYGRSKLLGETLLRETGKDFWLVRTAWLYGAHGKNFVNTIVARLSTQSEIRVVADQHGSPTFVGDLARAIHELVRDRAPYGIYHLVNAGVATWADLADPIVRRLGKNTRVERVPTGAYPLRASRPTWSVLQNTKRPPLRHWQEALADYLTSRQRVPSADA